MRKAINSLSHGLLAACLLLSSAMTQAIPKAAEHEDAAVTFGEAAAPPKPTARQGSPAAAKAPSQAVAKGTKGTKGTKGAKRTRQPVAKGSRQAVPARKTGSASPKGASSSVAAKTAPSAKAPAKAKSVARK